MTLEEIRDEAESRLRDATTTEARALCLLVLAVVAYVEKNDG